MEDTGPMSTGWYTVMLMAGVGKQTGPLTWDQLYGLARSGALQPTDAVWHPQLPAWLPAAEVPGLIGPAPAAPWTVSK